MAMLPPPPPTNPFVVVLRRLWVATAALQLLGDVAGLLLLYMAPSLWTQMALVAFTAMGNLVILVFLLLVNVVVTVLAFTPGRVRAGIFYSVLALGISLGAVLVLLTPMGVTTGVVLLTVFWIVQFLLDAGVSVFPLRYA